MPHTSRSKKKPQNQRYNVTNDDGWTKVAVGPGRRWRQSENLFIEHDIAPIEEGLTVPKLRSEYDRTTTRWRSSQCRKIVIDRLQSDLIHDGRIRNGGNIDRPVLGITKAVCLALGSPAASSSWNGGGRHRSMWQLVFFMDTVEALKEVDITIHAQEPRFSSLDCEFLESLGIKIVGNDDALDLIDATTILYVPSLEWSTENVYRARASICPLYITSNMDWVLEEAERHETMARPNE